MELFEPCTPTGPELCFDARDDNCNGLIDEGCGVRTGLVQFALAWPEAAADLDLEVTDPAGELAEAGHPTKGGLVKERDCPGPNHECRGQNLENVYQEQGNPLRGRYRIRVRLEKVGDAPPPIRGTLGARVGPRTYSVRLVLSRPGDTHELTVDL
jgi:hypothetical protein